MKERRLFQLSNRERYSLFTAFVVFCALVLALTGYLNLKALADSRQMLEASVKSQLISAAAAASETIDKLAFDGYETIEDTNSQGFQAQLAQLRSLASRLGVKYIYALKMVGGVPVFIFDTDVEDEPFRAYALSKVHEDAFAGREVAGISNLKDEWGSYSTGAVPLMLGNRQVGVVAVDIEDALLRQNEITARTNFILLMCALGAVLLLMSALVYVLLGRLKKMQDHLKRMANYDKLTNLPNRQFLLDYLQEITQGDEKPRFALFFIDLDNFKKVNDNAGHDAGDTLLKNIGSYLVEAQKNSRVFRPGPGMLNIAARIGGDEFVLIVPGVGTAQEASGFAQELLEGFRRQEINRYIEKYAVGLSIGVALYPYHSDNYNVLIKYADIAMYHAKFGGKNCYRIYDDEMSSKEDK